MIKRTFTLLTVIFTVLVFSACQNSHGHEEHHELPEKGADWNSVMKIKGHDSHRSSVFELHGQEAVIQFNANPIDHHAYSRLQVFVSDGSEELYENPELEVFNNHGVGEIEIDKAADNYMLYIRVTNMAYELEVYEKKSAEKTE